MPLPKPRDGESEDDFLDRCMSNNTMNEEYPDEKQRYAVCQTQWKEKKMSNEKLKEVRCLNLEDINLRVIRKEDGALPRIEGYAAVFNSDSEDMGFVERIKPGAFKGALKISDARALFNHDPNYVLGRQSNGTLTLKEDNKGLFMSVQPPDTQIIRDMVLSPIERGDITQQSFGFIVDADEWEDLDSNKPIRTITKVRELFDVSPVTYPAYQDTSVGLRSLEKARQEKENPIETEQIEIVLKRDEGEDRIYFFENKEVFEEFMSKADEIRSSLSPTTAEPDNTTDVQTNDKSEENRLMLERIDKKLEKHKEK